MEVQGVLEVAPAVVYEVGAVVVLVGLVMQLNLQWEHIVAIVELLGYEFVAVALQPRLHSVRRYISPIAF